jgi:excisionase family DNA binding protein
MSDIAQNHHAMQSRESQMQQDAVRPSQPSSARDLVRGRMGGGGDAGKLLTAEEVADRLDVGVKWVWAQARAGLIPHVKLGRYKRFRSEAIDAWLAQLEDGGAD